MKTGFPIAGGILTIVASIISVIFAIIIGFMGLLGTYFGSSLYSALFIGILGLIAFGFGLAGAILSIRREGFVLSAVGICVVMLQGLLIVVVSVADYNTGISWLLFGLPILVLSASGFFFVGISESEFT